MSEVTNATVEYYSDLLELSQEAAFELCQPQETFAESSATAGIQVQSMRKLHYGAPPALTEASRRAEVYMQRFAVRLQSVNSPDSSPVWRQPGPDIYTSSFHGISDELNKVLLPQQITTGRIASLAVRAVAPSELPMKIEPKRKDVVLEAGDPDHDQYFVISGETVAGGRVGAIACGMLVRSCLVPAYAPYTSARTQYVSTPFIKRFPDKSLSAVLMWNNSRHEAATIERVNRRNAYGALDH